MTLQNDLVRENLATLTQAIDLLAQLTDQLYGNNENVRFQSGAGKHMRHVMDFYSAFLDGLPAGIIDYDARGRHPELESSRKAAAAKLRELRARIETIDALDREVTCKNDGDRRDPATAFSRSTIGRELQFLASHTVHHFAIVAMILDRQGFQTNRDFGVAPSTLVYWQKTGSGPTGATL
ncbi:MAG: DinB family protein [Desulfosarcina sp.]|nr:DinB family protein [Desulfobacterales bacterium]